MTGRRAQALVPLLAAAAALAPAVPAGAQQRVQRADVAVHLRALDAIARAGGGNRAAGEPGEAATVEYVAGRMREAGFEVAVQPVPFPYFAERSPPVVGGLRPGRDAVTLDYSGSADVAARVRPLRRSGCAPRHFRGFARGRIALSLYGTCPYRRIALNAQRAGAAAVLFTSGFRRRAPLTATMAPPAVTIPALTLRDPVAERLARRRPRIRVRVDAFVEQRTGHNVVAELAGTRGARVVMAGGHLDSVRAGPGLNDNGSGVAALLAIGTRLAAGPRRRHTVRLGFWTAEEQFLYGSRAYVRGLGAAERRRVLGYVNLDMVGSPNGVPEIYRGDRRILRALRRRLPGAGRTPVGVPSDHAPFRRAGIPVGGVYTGSLERKTRRQARRWGGRAGALRDPCYHRACDGLANVDARMAARVAEATRGALAALAR